MNLFPNMEAAAIVNTIGCGGKQSCLCSQGCCLRWLMCPLAPIGASAGGGGAPALRHHTWQKQRTPGLAGKGRSPVLCSPPEPGQRLFLWIGPLRRFASLTDNVAARSVQPLMLKRLMTTDKRSALDWRSLESSRGDEQQNTGNSSPSRVFVC